MKTEKTFSLIFLVSLIFKIQHWPYGHQILLISLLLISMIYFFAAFYFFCDKSIKRQNLALSIVSGLFLSLIPFALFLKLSYQFSLNIIYGIPTDQFFLLIGSVSATIILIVIYFLKSKSTENLATYYKNMFSRTIVLTVLSVSFYIIPTVTIIKFQNRHDKEIARLKVLAYTNPDNYYYYQRLIDEYVQKRDSLKIERDKTTK